MANKSILPDTCAWIEYFRDSSSSLGLAIEKALDKDDVVLCGPVLSELVQGVRSEKEHALLSNALAGLTYLEMTEALWIKAGQLAAALRKKGKTLPFSDVVIAALAIEYNLTVLTIDTHFELVPGLDVRTS